MISSTPSNLDKAAANGMQMSENARGTPCHKIKKKLASRYAGAVCPPRARRVGAGLRRVAAPVSDLAARRLTMAVS